MKDISASCSSNKGCVSLGSSSATESTGHVDDMDLSEICEVVISLKCKKCDFLCHDKSTLAQHIKSVHLSKLSSSSNCNSNIEISKERNVEVRKDNENGHKETEVKPIKDVHVKEGGSVSKKSDKVKSRNYCKLDGNSTHDNSSIEVDTLEVSTGDDTSVGDESVEDVFLCAECDIVFSSRETCCSHMHKVHGLNQFSADFIQEEIISKPNEEPKATKKRRTRLPRKFTQDAGAIVPKKYRVTKDIFHSCTKCTIKFESVDVTKFHEKCHMTSFVKAEEVSSEAMLSTRNISTAPKGFLCPVCESNEDGTAASQYFSKWGPCAWHLWKEHRIDCELYTCSVCKQFKSHLSARVKDHEQLHSTKASYKCATCNKTFKQLKQLRCHEKYHKEHSTKLAPDIDARWYTPKECPICKRILSDSKCLKKHISAVHKKLKPYVCNICGHTSARKQELMLHVRQHTGEKPYKCPMCPFETGDHNSLRKHKLRHSDERPYACPYCDYRCIQSCAFKKHILACHPGQEVVFICQLCSHKSVNETLFTAHQKDHAEGRIAGADEPNAEAASSRNVSDDNGANNVVSDSSSGDEESLNIIDNGGVTIPASPPSPEFQGRNGDTQKPKLNPVEVAPAKRKVKKESAQITAPQLTTEKPPISTSLMSTTLTVTSTAGNHIEKIPAIVISRSRSSNLPENGIITVNASTLQIHSQPETQPQQVYCSTTTFTTPHSFPSPRYIALANNGFASPSTNSDSIQQADIRAHNTTEDPESSTSEIITNPDQLIQNIQLTPLDLTDIINCNEQSNDDGMLQRLLDMSGV